MCEREKKGENERVWGEGVHIGGGCSDEAQGRAEL